MGSKVNLKQASITYSTPGKYILEQAIIFFETQIWVQNSTAEAYPRPQLTSNLKDVSGSWPRLCTSNPIDQIYYTVV